jgi:DNA mismatch endonuclease (patch repair protein)
MASISESNRRKIMQSIRHENTMPEVELRKFLYVCGIRYRKNYGSLPGKPDIAITSKQLAIFVHGCFWHQHRNCRITNFPSRNTKYWSKKFKANKERDKKNQAELVKLGWTPMVIWECEILDINRKVRDLEFVLGKIGNLAG